MVRLLLITLLIVIGSKVVYKDDYAVLTGSITISANDSNSATINYPSGFTAENSVVISCGIQNVSNKGMNYVGYNKDSSYSLNNSWDRRLNLTSTGIILVVDNPNSAEKVVDYKIVLMKL